MKVLKWPDRILDTPAQEVDLFDDKLKTLVEAMHATMDENNGIGLAANQVGVLKRVIVMYIPYTDEDKRSGVKLESWHNKRMTFINPKIIASSKVKENFREGCLSFPGIYDYVPRFATVTVEAADENGNKHTYEAADLFSCCLQHEIDHIDGVVFFKRMSRLKAELVKNKVSKNS